MKKPRPTQRAPDSLRRAQPLAQGGDGDEDGAEREVAERVEGDGARRQRAGETAPARPLRAVYQRTRKTAAKSCRPMREPSPAAAPAAKSIPARNARAARGGGHESPHGSEGGQARRGRARRRPLPGTGDRGTPGWEKTSPACRSCPRDATSGDDRDREQQERRDAKRAPPAARRREAPRRRRPLEERGGLPDQARLRENRVQRRGLGETAESAGRGHPGAAGSPPRAARTGR
jgi:hypothetical protein